MTASIRPLGALGVVTFARWFAQQKWRLIMHVIKACAVSVLVGVPSLAASGAVADTGIFGGWAAAPEDCQYVTYQGVMQDVTAGIITPDNLYYHDGECYYTGIFPQPPNGMVLKGVCDDGDGEGPYEATLETVTTGPQTMRALLPDYGWTTLNRCWDLPDNWRELSQ